MILHSQYNFLKSPFSLLLLLILAKSACAQRQKPNLSDRKNTFYLAPLNLFDLRNPCLQIGFERMLKGNIAYQIELGYIINHSVENYIIDKINGINGDQFSNSGFKLKNEIKYIARKVKGGYLFYAIDIFYTQNRSGVRESFGISDTNFQYSTYRPPGTNAYDDFFINDMKKYGVNLKAGLKIFFKKRKFVFEPHIGVGIAYRKTKQYDRENINDKLLWNDPMNWNLKNGNMFDISFPLNAKIGYRF
jgi:hypothetical protein